MLIHHLLPLTSSFPGVPFLLIHLMLHAVVGAWTPIPSTLGPTPVAAGVLAMLQYTGHLYQQAVTSTRQLHAPSLLLDDV